jgi:hypothetical protein
MRNLKTMYQFDESSYDLVNCVLVFNSDNPDKEIWIEVD